MPRLLALALLACALAGARADAAPIAYDQTRTVTGFANPADNPPPPVTLTFTATPLPTGGGTLTLTLFGDFSDPSGEYADVIADPAGAAVDLGRILDGILGNDRFDFPGDTGNQYGSALTGTALLTAAEMALLTADGQVDVRLTFGPNVSNLSDAPDEFVTGRLQYAAADAGAVPEPATLATLGLLAGVGGLVARRRKTTPA